MPLHKKDKVYIIVIVLCFVQTGVYILASMAVAHYLKGTPFEDFYFIPVCILYLFGINKIFSLIKD